MNKKLILTATIVVLFFVTALFLSEKSKTTTSQLIIAPTVTQTLVTQNATSVPSQQNITQTLKNADASNWKIYKSDKYGFELQYPAYWIMPTEDVTGQTIVFGTNPDELVVKEILVHEWEVTPSENNADKIFSSKFSQSFLETLAKESIKIDTVTATYYHGIAYTDEGCWTENDIPVLHKNKMYIISRSLNCSLTSYREGKAPEFKDEYDQGEKEFRQILSSFKFLDQ